MNGNDLRAGCDRIEAAGQPAVEFWIDRKCVVPGGVWDG